MCVRSSNLLQTECRDPEGNTRGELDEEHVEGVEERLVTLDVRVLHLKVVHHVWKHRPGREKATFKDERVEAYERTLGGVLRLNSPWQQESCSHAHSGRHRHHVGDDQGALDADDQQHEGDRPLWKRGRAV